MTAPSANVCRADIVRQELLRLAAAFGLGLALCAIAALAERL